MAGISQREFAERLGITARQVRNLYDAGLPRTVESGKPAIPWPDALHWYVAWKTERQRSVGEEEKAALARRRLELEVRLQEIEVAEREGRVVTIEYLADQVAAMQQRLRAKLLNFAGKYAPAMVGLKTVAEAQARLEPAIAEAMQALAETGEDPELDERDPDADEAAA